MGPNAQGNKASVKTMLLINMLFARPNHSIITYPNNIEGSSNTTVQATSHKYSVPVASSSPKVEGRIYRNPKYTYPIANQI